MPPLATVQVLPGQGSWDIGLVQNLAQGPQGLTHLTHLSVPLAKLV